MVLRSMVADMRRQGWTLSNDQADEMVARIRKEIGEKMETVYTCDTWKDTIAAMHSGEKIEIDEGVFDYFLEVLPPVYMGRTVALPCGETRCVSFGFAEGYEPVTAFWSTKGRYYCQRTAEINTRC